MATVSGKLHPLAQSNNIMKRSSFNQQLPQKHHPMKSPDRVGWAFLRSGQSEPHIWRGSFLNQLPRFFFTGDFNIWPAMEISRSWGCWYLGGQICNKWSCPLGEERWVAPLEPSRLARLSLVLVLIGSLCFPGDFTMLGISSQEFLVIPRPGSLWISLESAVLFISLFFKSLREKGSSIKYP